ncbi:MAG: 50S ribosomal protein L11 [candidate division TM6 bacterium GW2011_GWE2_42_60]|nr:MAG: 50S ribosomal protein L11 [candidate division TM6 bacterium GW2011_GWE2_42_60]HBY05698.1 50S ribosomal protein L11 [Candidatus Dependentiae bacterium]
MAKKIKAIVRLQLPAGAATPAPPTGSVLGPHGINIMDFCKQFNAKTSDRKGQTVPAVITIYVDRSFDFILKTQPTAELIKSKCRVEKGSARPNSAKVGKLSWKDVEDIAKIKLVDLNAVDIEAAKKIIAGSARSMGVDVTD